MIKKIKTVFLFSAFGVLTALAAGCASPSTPPNNSSTANSAPIVETEPVKPMGTDKGDAVVTGSDLDFINAAAPGGIAEVKLGKLALTKSSNADVKAFAQKMIDDHSKAGDELKSLATQKKVMLSSELMPAHKQLMEKLSKLSGANFDKEYVTAMVEDHQKDVAAFENVSKTAADADVKAFATKTLPTLKTHLQMIENLAGEMGVKMK